MEVKNSAQKGTQLASEEIGSEIDNLVSSENSAEDTLVRLAIGEFNIKLFNLSSTLA